MSLHPFRCIFGKLSLPLYQEFNIQRDTSKLVNVIEFRAIYARRWDDTEYNGCGEDAWRLWIGVLASYDPQDITNVRRACPVSNLRRLCAYPTHAFACRTYYLTGVTSLKE